MASDMAAIKVLRTRTNAPMMECRAALDEAGGDIERAAKLLAKRSLAVADKKSGRTAAEGRIESYVHHDGKTAVIVEVNCETDFVARTPEFQQFCREAALQIAATRPQFVSRDAVAEAALREAAATDDLDAAAQELCLLQQPFVKDPSQTMDERLRALIGQLRENIVVRRFSRFQLGETA